MVISDKVRAKALALRGGPKNRNASWYGKSLAQLRYEQHGPNGTIEKNANMPMPIEMKSDRIPWLDGPPTELGWYWYRLNTSGAIRGPVEVVEGRPGEITCAAGEGSHQRVELFERAWAGPIPYPEEVD